MKNEAILALENGEIFRGCAIGAQGTRVGEVVFNTSLTGYQEILSDPSYTQQIITLTYPHIGNVGCNAQDDEAKKVWAAGLIVRDCPTTHSNWRSDEDLSSYLQRHQVLGISQIDTRHLTRVLRDKGAQRGCITTNVHDTQLAIRTAREFPGLNGLDLAKLVSCEKIYEWNEGTISFDDEAFERVEKNTHVVVYDYGVKQNMLRLLVDHGCRVTVVPAKTSVAEVLALKPDGVLLSNGPGDPAACDYAIAAIKTLLEKNIPLFGICLGFQLLALAANAQSMKMKFGHHGSNHPVFDVDNSRVLITSQNHGFTIDEKTLSSDIEVTHRSLFDGSLQGIRFRHKPALGFQGHPEASPGPHDVLGLFQQFMNLMK